MGFLRHYLIAVHSFTRVPVSGSLAEWMGPHAAMAPSSAAHFPGVGWLIGIVGCAVFALIGLVLQGSLFASLVAAAASTMVTVWLTGGAHELALTRAAKALGSITLTLALIGKVALLALLAARSPVAVLVALLGAHVVSRLWPLLLVKVQLADGDAASSRSVLPSVGSRDLGIAGAWTAAALLLVFAGQGFAVMLTALALSALAFLALRSFFAAPSRGSNTDSDAAGATQQACEIAFYLGAAIAPMAR
jgi:adenosylcobinamide-GDP ribazoletransferase